MEDNSIKSEIDALRSKFNMMWHDLKGIGTEVSELRSDVNELKADMKKVKSDIAEIKEMHKASAKTLEAHFSTGRPEVIANLQESKNTQTNNNPD